MFAVLTHKRRNLSYGALLVNNWHLNHNISNEETEIVVHAGEIIARRFRIRCMKQQRAKYRGLQKLHF